MIIKIFLTSYSYDCINNIFVNIFFIFVNIFLWPTTFTLHIAIRSDNIFQISSMNTIHFNCIQPIFTVKNPYLNLKNYVIWPTANLIASSHATCTCGFHLFLAWEKLQRKQNHDKLSELICRQLAKSWTDFLSFFLLNVLTKLLFTTYSGAKSV